MRLFHLWCSPFLILTLTLIVYAEWYKDQLNDTCTVLTEFNKFHTDLNKLSSMPWPLADDLNESTLRKVCDEVLADNYPPFQPPGQFPYMDPVGNVSLQEERVVRNAQVVCVQGIKSMPLIFCVYNGTEFWLAQGDATHVFRMGKDPIDDLFYFQSGPHVIHYNNSYSP